MPPVYDENEGSSGPSGSQHQVPRDAEELHDRTHQFLSTVGPALDSIESLLDSWDRFRETSAASTGLPQNSGFRTVRIDPFTVRQPPPSIAEAEITQYIKKLSRKDLKALHDEYELTCVENFEYVQAEAENGAETAAQAAARIVHFADEDDEDSDEAVRQSMPLSVSPTTRAKALFEEEGASVDRLGVKPDGRIAEIRTAATTDAAALPTPASPSQTPPAFSLEQMSPSAIAAHERRRTASSDSSSSSYAGMHTRSPTTADVCATESYTVEIEYTADHFFPSAAQRALRDNASGAIMITPGTHQTMRSGAAAATAVTAGKAALLQSDSDNEGEKSEADVQSFTTFSRMVLANEGRRLTSQRTQAEASASTGVARPVVDFISEHQSSTDAMANAEALPTPPPPAASAGAAAPTPPAAAPAANTVSIKVMRNADPASGRDAFVRQRVRDILLANRVRTADAAALGEAFFAKLDAAWNAAATQTTPVLRRLNELLRESSALLHMLEVMDHQAYRERVTDPAQYLCVPRYSAACAAADCNAAFSAIVTRVMCGRCGQLFCPACCAERGMGPDVVCDGQRYSLGWEPLCRVCFQMCRDSQQQVMKERNLYLRIENAASYHDLAGGDSGEEAAARRASADSLTLKQAVLFGAYCDEQHCLSDGLPPFYVMDRSVNESVAFWDVLQYQVAKTQGSFRRGWQSAGKMATHAVQSAAQMVSKRRADLRAKP